MCILTPKDEKCSFLAHSVVVTTNMHLLEANASSTGRFFASKCRRHLLNGSPLWGDKFKNRT